MQELLQALESKIRCLIEEKELCCRERDALALKVIELQEALQAVKKEMEVLKQEGEQSSQDFMLASMMVEDIINKLDEHSANPQV